MDVAAHAGTLRRKGCGPAGTEGPDAEAPGGPEIWPEGQEVTFFDSFRMSVSLVICSACEW